MREDGSFTRSRSRSLEHALRQLRRRAPGCSKPFQECLRDAGNCDDKLEPVFRALCSSQFCPQALDDVIEFIDGLDLPGGGAECVVHVNEPMLYGQPFQTGVYALGEFVCEGNTSYVYYTANVCIRDHLRNTRHCSDDDGMYTSGIYAPGAAPSLFEYWYYCDHLVRPGLYDASVGAYWSGGDYGTQRHVSQDVPLVCGEDPV